jgi:hypothetical protein
VVDFGESGSFKSFLAIDRLLCIAAGIPYHGHAVKQGCTFYVVGEGRQGIGRRIAAWHAKHKTNHKDIPFYISELPTQLTITEALMEVRASIEKITQENGLDFPILVYYDSLARNFGPGNENSTEDMGVVVQNIDFVFKGDCSSGFIHHPGHLNKDRERGSVALPGAADERYRVSLNSSGDQILVKCLKMKNYMKPPSMLFQIEEVPLYLDGIHDKSYVLNLLAEGEEAEAQHAEEGGKTKKMSDKQKDLLAIYDEIYRYRLSDIRKQGDSDSLPMIPPGAIVVEATKRKLYSKNSNAWYGLKSLVERELLYFSLDETAVCRGSQVPEYIEKGYPF